MNETATGAAEIPLQLSIFDHFPGELLDATPSTLWQHLQGPSLFYISGRQTQPLFASVLLHGNEHTGWEAVQSILRAHKTQMLPRSLILFVANIGAAKAGVRTLPGQLDFNRAWPGTPHVQTAEAALMQEVYDRVQHSNPFASVDIHNNTGNNPHYACITDLSDPFFHMARLFSRTVVYFTTPVGVQSAALARLCPAITVECGQSGGNNSLDHAIEFVSSLLHLSTVPSHPLPDGDIDLLETHAVVTVPPSASISFDGSSADFQFRADLDTLNFSELESGTFFGTLGGDGQSRLCVSPGIQRKTNDEYFAYSGTDIRLSQDAVPAMLTLDKNAIRLDCLGYLMHRIGRDGHRIR